MDNKAAFGQLHQAMMEIADINHAIALLQWDMEIYMPPKGTDFRSRQIATLSGKSHEAFINPKVGDLLKSLSGKDLTEKESRNISILLKDYQKKKKYTTNFIIELSQQVSRTYQAWVKAREENDFSIYSPELSYLVELKQQETEILGYDEHPYDALMDEFEPGMRTSKVAQLFDKIKAPLKGMIDKISEKETPDDRFMYHHYPKDKQWEWSIFILRQLGYDFDAGRQDISRHPFTISFNPMDVRVTTRVHEQNLYVLTWSSIHEGGHALYEQGLNVLDYGLPSGNAVSLSMHESQSRLYENNIGRGELFWQANYPLLQQSFPEQLGDVSLKQFYHAINKVQPSLIRTEADELTYHMHIMIRFEIEKALIEDKIVVKDIPEMWNQHYKDYLNVEVPDDVHGALQDVHWSHGSFGYFPTYSLGSFYAAQFYNKMIEKISGLEDQIASGDMKNLLGWLRENIHSKGRLYEAEELCKQITGESLNFRHFMEYAERKYGSIYQL